MDPVKKEPEFGKLVKSNDKSELSIVKWGRGGADGREGRDSPCPWDWVDTHNNYFTVFGYTLIDCRYTLLHYGYTVYLTMDTL